jgi:predicted ester cyclase
MASIEDVLGRAIGHWNAGDLDGYLDLYDDSIKLHGYSAEPMDKAAVVRHYRAVWAALAADGSANPRLDIKDVLSNGDRLACRFALSGLHQGPFMGVPATGSPYLCQGITIMRFVGSRVVERWSMTDAVKQFTRIGAALSRESGGATDRA